MSTKAAENNNLVPAQPKTKDEGTPENNAKIHVHDATEKTEDIKPKQVGPENAKEILTGALAQKVSEFNARFKKKAADSMVPAAKPTVNDIHMGGFAAGTGTVGAALGGAAGGTLGGLAGLIDPGTYEENGVKKQRGRLMGGLMGAGKGALGGAVGGGAVGGLGGAGLLQMLRNMENARTAPKTAALNDYGSIGGGAMVGGLGGAALGGLAGLMSPGQDTEYDNYGRPVGSKQRSRLGAALRGALGGGAIGGLGGAAAGHFMPGETNQALAALQPYLNSAQAYGKDMYNKMLPQKTDSTPAPFPNAAAAGGSPKAEPAASAGADTYVGEGGGTSAPMLPPNAAVTGPVAKKPGQFDNFFRNLANGAVAGPW